VEKLYKIPLLFFLIASFMGLFLRSQLVFPVKGITFSFLLHGHSHTMFLGWVFNTLFIAFVTRFTSAGRTRFENIFWILQVLTFTMLISFPLQGYGVFSISFSALHTLVVFIFVGLFFKRTQGRNEVSVWLARISLIFFVISSIGPFCLGYLKANGLEHTAPYRNAIYFYLHFQYNGCFFFGILSLFIDLIESYAGPLQLKNIKVACHLFIIAAFPTYALSTLWSHPGAFYYVVGAIGAMVQLTGLLLFLKGVRPFVIGTSHQIKPQFTLALRIISIALLLKMALQFASAHPAVADLINEYRSIVVAYLHLMLVGVVSFFLIGWLIQHNIIAQSFSKWGTSLLFFGFIGSELLLFIVPWGEHFLSSQLITTQFFLLIFSCLMAIGVLFHFAGSVVSKGAHLQ
jgi:hypothetical protein